MRSDSRLAARGVKTCRGLCQFYRCLHEGELLTFDEIGDADMVCSCAFSSIEVGQTDLVLGCHCDDPEFDIIAAIEDM